MKTFVCALLIFALLCTFVFINSYSISKKLDELITTTASLPKNEEDIKSGGEELRRQIEALRGKWSENMSMFAYFLSYDLLDRADQAIIELYCAYFSGNTGDFLYAAENFRDAAARLKILCGAGFESFA